VTIDTAHTRLIVNIGRSVIEVVAVVVLIEEVLVRVTPVEGVVVDRGIKETTVVCGIGEVVRVVRILSVVCHVFILVKTDPPELKHGAV
jgi:hypothetical protein